jgi:hypothetical protein
MGAYDLSPMPKYYVELKGAGHFAWTDLRRTFHDPIVAYSIAFLDRYVRGSAASPLLTHATSAVAILRYRVESGHLPIHFDVDYPPGLSAGEHDER